jgi:hypothetical protein
VTAILPAESLKRSTVTCFLIPLVFFLCSGCAGIAGKGRMEDFRRISKAYEWALESANYRGAAGYLDPSIDRPPIDFKRYANIKVSEYTITRSDTSDDQQVIRQDVELQYFLLDQSIVKTIMDHQVWRYSEAEDVWLLQTGLPGFPE